MPSIIERFRRSWNAFMGRDPTINDLGFGAGYRLDKTWYHSTNIRTIMATIYNRIAVDVAAIDFKHVRLNDDGFYQEEIDSDLNNCLTCEANIDQTGRAFIQDAVMSMFDEGHVVLVPTSADLNETRTKVQEACVYNVRTGKVVTWYPQAVKVNVYNDISGKREDIILPKSLVCVIENPFYSIMNEPNSTLQRLLQTITKLDKANDQNTAGKLDLIIQLPYVIKSDMRKQQAEERRKLIEEQLTSSKYGVAYTDGTEKIVQLNRSLENNLFEQVKTLSTELYNQLGITDTILNGTADEQTMINYQKRTVEPICSAIANEIERKWLTQTARTRKHAVRFFSDPFKLVPVSQIAEMSDKFTRNEIMSSNEIRAKIALKPSNDPKADQLINSNLNQSPEQMEAMGLGGDVPMDPTAPGATEEIDPTVTDENMNKSFEEMEEFIKSGGRENGG